VFQVSPKRQYGSTMVGFVVVIIIIIIIIIIILKADQTCVQTPEFLPV
jgi:hypothetical protein